MVANVEQRAAKVEAQLKLERARLELQQVRFFGRALRQRRKMLATYDGAKRDRRDRDWNPTNKSADAAIIPDGPTMLARARALDRDTPVGRSIKRSYRRNAVGRGITHAAAAMFKGGKKRKAFNRDADDLFDLWANDPNFCDAEGRKTFWEIQALAAAEITIAGEFLVLFEDADNGQGMIPLRLKCIEAEQLDTLKVRDDSTNNAIRGGVEVDASNRAVAYHVIKRRTDDLVLGVPTGLGDSVRIPADRVLHLFDVERVGQTRGVTWLAPAIRKMRDHSEYDQLEMWWARMQACHGIGFERPAPENDGEQRIGFATGDSTDDTDDEGNRQVNWAPGMVLESLPGEKLHFYSPNRPSGTYEPFTKAQIRQIAAATGLSYEQVARDFSSGNFSSQRQALLEDRREWRMLQEYLVRHLCQPVWATAIRLAVLGNLITAPGFFQNRALYLKCMWQPDGWDWIDPAKEGAGHKLKIEQFLDTRERILNESGSSVREVLEQRKAERDEARQLGFEFPEDKAEATKVDPSEPRPQGASKEARPGPRKSDGRGKEALADELAAHDDEQLLEEHADELEEVEV